MGQRDGGGGHVLHETVAVAPAAASGFVQRFQLVVLEGPSQGTSCESAGDRCSVGSHPSNDLVIEDPTVSRFHCEVWIEAGQARARDLDSRNGTLLDGVRVREAWLRGGSLLRLGRSTVRFEFAAERNRLFLSEHTELGTMVGTSVAMRSLFAHIERAAPTDATVLLEGETGTGKERAAETIHRESGRRDGPFIVLDCGAVPATLLESELFGHEKGAFTGAGSRRIGAFEEASGGTILLDEIGELPTELQPKLLRVLEQRQIRRVGSNAHRSVDVRVIAATNRDLRAEVNAGRFRPDVYFRLAVLRIVLPPLRARPEDIPALVDRMLEDLDADPEASARIKDPDFLARLQRGAWPGNVRELRNAVERALVFGEQSAVPNGDRPPASSEPDVTLPFVAARRRALDAFERRYIEAALASHENPAQAARAAGIDRNYLYRMMKKHGLGT